jgi:glutathione S-transferase
VKLLNSLGPNPRLVRMFLHEKGLALDLEEVDLMGGENRRPPYTEKNPGGQLPSLVLDDGSVLGETVAICEYLEEKHPTPVLIGSTPEERAVTRQWIRRVEFKISENLYNGFRYAEGISLFKDRMRTLPEAADGLKACAQDGLAWLDGLIADRDWIVPDRFSLADIVLYNALDFGAGVGQPLNPELKNVAAWFARVGARPSAEASLHPVAATAGMRG